MSRLPTEIAQSLIPIYEREYQELCQNWSSIERKAQIIGGAVLALLTGGLALIAKSLYSQPAFVVVTLVIVAATLSVAGYLSAQALKPTDQTLPPHGSRFRDIAYKVKRDDNVVWTTDYDAEALHHQVVDWDQACKDLKASVDEKGSMVAKAHNWLIVAGALSLLAFTWIGVDRLLELVCQLGFPRFSGHHP